MATATANVMDGTETTNPVARAVGADIRDLRKMRGETLSDLASVLDRSIGWVSQVERGLADPGISDLKAIAGHYAVPVSFFFRNADAPLEEQGLVVRGASRSSLGSDEDGLFEELLSPDLSGQFEMIRSVFAPGAIRKVMPARPTEDGGYVVSGMLELTVGARTVLLKSGDSFQFNNQPYGWRNPGKEPAVVLWVIAPPVY